MQGFHKIRKTCEFAVRWGSDYAWVDTCCINKESSAELSEAINSMYRWYAASERCIAYLSDVDKSQPSYGQPENCVTASLWFTRGWTLQELLAPKRVDFYDCLWAALGDKLGLGNDICTHTRIQIGIIYGNEPLRTASIAQRMSWAAGRETTRDEDMAYCLLGIFDVNMPMLYGEGTKAFRRLQEEIIKNSDDQTIFAWSEPPENGEINCGMLATSPRAFLRSHKIENLRGLNHKESHFRYSITNTGLLLTNTRVSLWTTDIYWQALNCAADFFNHDRSLGLLLRKTFRDGQYIRVQDGEKMLVEYPEDGLIEPPFTQNIEMTVRHQDAVLALDDFRDRLHGFVFASNIPKYRFTEFSNGKSTTCYAADKGMHTCQDYTQRNLSIIKGYRPDRSGALIEFEPEKSELHAIKLTFDLDWAPVCFVANGFGTREIVCKYDNLISCPAFACVDGAGLIRSKALHDQWATDYVGWDLKSVMRGGFCLESPFHDGLWIAKGMHGFFTRYNLVRRLKVSFDYDKPLASLTISQQEVQGALAWKVELVEYTRNTRGIEDVEAQSSVG